MKIALRDYEFRSLRVLPECGTLDQVPATKQRQREDIKKIHEMEKWNGVYTYTDSRKSQEVLKRSQQKGIIYDSTHPIYPNLTPSEPIKPHTIIFHLLPYSSHPI
jgi:hypothetical protein